MKVKIKDTGEVVEVEYRIGIMGNPYYRDWARGVDYSEKEIERLEEDKAPKEKDEVSVLEKKETRMTVGELRAILNNMNASDSLPIRVKIMREGRTVASPAIIGFHQYSDCVCLITNID